MPGPLRPRPSRSHPPIAVLLAGLFLIVLSACSSAPPQNRFPDITFRHEPQIRLAVREISVENTYNAPAEPPNVEHRFPVRPGRTAERWARDRLSAEGGEGRLRYIVREASVVETELPLSKGLTGAVTTEQSERYDAVIRVELQMLGDDGRTTGTANVRAERSISVPEDITLTERERRWFRLTEDIMRELDKQLEETIKTVFFPQVIL